MLNNKAMQKEKYLVLSLFSISFMDHAFPIHKHVYMERSIFSQTTQRHFDCCVWNGTKKNKEIQNSVKKIMKIHFFFICLSLLT